MGSYGKTAGSYFDPCHPLSKSNTTTRIKHVQHGIVHKFDFFIFSDKYTFFYKQLGC